jgi:hypothetical protein
VVVLAGQHEERSSQAPEPSAVGYEPRALKAAAVAAIVEAVARVRAPPSAQSAEAAEQSDICEAVQASLFEVWVCDAVVAPVAAASAA